MSIWKEEPEFALYRTAWFGLLAGLAWFVGWSFIAPKAKDWYFQMGLAGKPLTQLSPENGSVLAQKTTKFVGTAGEPRVVLKVNDQQLAEAPVGWDGTYSIEVPSDKLIGQVSIHEANELGTSIKSVKSRYQIATGPNGDTAYDPEAQSQPKHQLVVSSHVTGDTIYVGNVIFEGYARPSATVLCFRDKYLFGSAKANAQGYWKIDTVIQSPGINRKFKFQDKNKASDFTIINLTISR